MSTENLDPVDPIYLYIHLLCRSCIMQILIISVLSLCFRFSDYSSRLPRTWLASEGATQPAEILEGMGIARGETKYK